MKHIFLNIKKFLLLDISTQETNAKAKKSLQEQWKSIYTYYSLNKLKITYFMATILLSFLLAYILANCIFLSDVSKVYIGFSIFYIACSIMISPIIYNILLTIVLLLSSILGKAEEKTENKADETTSELQNLVIPANYYLFIFILIHFPSFLILFCMKFTGINWSAVYYLCTTFVIAFFEIEVFIIVSYLFLDLTRDKACHYNLKYNTIN